MNKRLLPYWITHGVFVFVAIVVLVSCLLVTKSPPVRQVGENARVWKRYYSLTMNVSFDHPGNWQVLYDDKSSRTDVTLCPPELERITTHYLNANCISFLYGDAHLRTPGDIEGYNPVFLSFRSDLDSFDDEAYSNYRVMHHLSQLDDYNIGLVGLYRSRFNKIGMWQSTCATDKRSDCILIFDHVLGSISFNAETL